MLQLRKCLIILLASSVLLSGCWNARDIEQLIYIDSIGVDYVDKKVVVYLQILGFSNIAKKEGNAGQQPEPIAVVKGAGDTYVTALAQIYSSAQQRLIWSHVHSIVFTTRALKHNLLDQTIDSLDRYQEFRYTIWTFATTEPLEDIYNARPILGISTLYSQLADPKDVYSQYSFIRPLLLFRVISEYKDPNGVVRLPYLSIRKNQWKEDGRQMPHLMMEGICYLQNKKMLGCFPRSDLLGIRWLEQETERPFFHPDEKKSAILTAEKLRVKIKPQMQRGKPSFDIDIKVDAYTTQLLNPTPVPILEKRAAKQIESEVRALYQKGVQSGIDTIGLGHLFYRKYPREWHRLNRDGRLVLTNDMLKTVRVKVNLTDGGISKVRQHKPQSSSKH